MTVVPFFQGARRAWTLQRRAERKTTLMEVHRHIIAYCPDHGDQPTCRMVCHCEIADELERDLSSR